MIPRPACLNGEPSLGIIVFYTVYVQVFYQYLCIVSGEIAAFSVEYSSKISILINIPVQAVGSRRTVNQVFIKCRSGLSV